VHEKHILLPLLPATAALAHESPLLVGWLSALCCFSMFPLLERDGLGLAYLAHLILCCSLGALSHAALAGQRGVRDVAEGRGGKLGVVLCWLEQRALPPAAALSAVGMVALHCAARMVPPPARYPDIHSYLFCAYACAHFCAAWLALQVWHVCQLLGLAESESERGAMPGGDAKED
jgi:alpha-1,3-glucosyltransferase